MALQWAAAPARGAAQAAGSYRLEPTGDGTCTHLPKEDQDPCPVPPGSVVLDGRAGPLVVGREEPANVLLDVPTVSGLHAKLEVVDNGVAVTDLGSTNKTYVGGYGRKFEVQPNDTKVAEQGMEVIFGDEHLARFRLEVDAAEDAAAPEAAE